MKIYVLRCYSNVVKAFYNKDDAYEYFNERYRGFHEDYDITELTVE